MRLLKGTHYGYSVTCQFSASIVILCEVLRIRSHHPGATRPVPSAGIEPATSSLQMRRSAQLSYDGIRATFLSPNTRSTLRDGSGYRIFRVLRLFIRRGHSSLPFPFFNHLLPFRAEPSPCTLALAIFFDALTPSAVLADAGHIA